jgi:cation transport protein ChaC
MQQPLWVFGYGSLIWDAGFPVAERRIARLDGWHRSFCMRSIHHRGTVDQPGLVLALDRADGASCTGVAFRVEPGAEAATLAALRERELVSSAYLEMTLPVRTDAGPIIALAYVIDPDHAQYCHLDRETQARIIAGAVGGRGPNRDYLWSTAAHLAELGIADADLEWLATRVRDLI